MLYKYSIEPIQVYYSFDVFEGFDLKNNVACIISDAYNSERMK